MGLVRLGGHDFGLSGESDLVLALVAVARHYVAVDDGESDVIRAWRVTWARFEGLEQGDVITARLTRNLCCVRWIVAAEDAAAAG